MMTIEDHRTFVCAGTALPRPPALSHGASLAAPDAHRFVGTSRAGVVVDELVLHETVTRSAADAVRVLDRRGLGVHFIIAEDGSVDQHADPALDRLAHAGRFHNPTSVGIEVTNPYYPRYLRRGLPWSRVIDAPWAHEKRYVLPTPEQAEAAAQLTAWLTSPAAAGLSIPRTWVGLIGTQLEMGRIESARRATPGVMAHTYFGHADGAWLVLYAWLRLEAGLAPCTAYEEAARRAEGVRRVDLSDLWARVPTGEGG